MSIRKFLDSTPLEAALRVKIFLHQNHGRVTVMVSYAFEVFSIYQMVTLLLTLKQLKIVFKF